MMSEAGGDWILDVGSAGGEERVMHRFAVRAGGGAPWNSPILNIALRMQRFMQHPRAAAPGRRGHTLLELVVAIAVAALVSGLVFASYTAVQGAFRRHAIKAEGVQRMVVARAGISRVLRSIGTVEHMAPKAITFVEREDSVSRTLECRDSTLYLDNQPLVDRVVQCGFSMTGTSHSGEKLIMWEIVLDGGKWLGGARAVDQAGFLRPRKKPRKNAS
ncbi:MAG: prepilin-type N-terminal cleavage/methylation domain-containing protein [Chitinivibrionales bacterium]|nr:prepilin-type N-terminal cleavage/methylation domain-containing protein [Chitinivibrionales bacterium]MBD3394235.1 prepilin-type N-terminal cleavage/methylation domain-containing protein [Chitinivibrionales bacterium]